MNNRYHNATNKWQGDYKRVLCVCSAGLLRSPTAAMVLAQEPFNYNTRAVGLEASYALVPLDGCLLHWADEIVVMTREHKTVLQALHKEQLEQDPKPIVNLGIPDEFEYRNPKLISLIKERYQLHLNEKEMEAAKTS